MPIFSKEELDTYRGQGLSAPVSTQPQGPVRKKPKQGGLGGFLTSLISEGGAIGGGVQGAAVGSTAGPIGTLVGGAIGAGLGGFGGRLAENKIRDDEYKLGEAAKEGAVSAVFGASPIKAGKGVLAATKAAAGGAEKAVVKEAAEKAITSPGFLSRLTGKVGGKLGQSAERLEARSSGLGVGEKVAGEKLTPQETKRLLKVAIDEGMPLGHPETKASFVTNKLEEIGGQIDKNLTKTNRALSDKERLSLVNGLADKVDKNVVLKNNPAAQKALNEIQTSISEINDFKGLVSAKRDLQSQINFIRNSATPTPKTEAVLNAAQKTLNEFTGGLNPELKALNGRFGDLSKIQEGTVNAAGKLSNSSEAGGGSFWSKLMGGDTAQSLKSGAGRTGMAVTGGGDDAFKDALALKGQGYGGFAKRILGSKGLTSTGNDPDQEEPVPESVDQTQVSQDMGMGEQVDSSDQFSSANVQANVQQILAQGGDFDDVAKYLGIVETMQKLSGGEQKPLNSTSAGTITDLQNGIANLGSLSEEFDTSGANMPLVGNLLAKIPGNTSAKNLQADVSRVKQVIGKALEGGVLRKEDEEKYAKILPTLTDTDEQAKYKIKQIATDLQRKLMLYQQNIGGGGGGTDLSTLGL